MKREKQEESTSSREQILLIVSGTDSLTADLLARILETHPKISFIHDFEFLPKVDAADSGEYSQESSQFSSIIQALDHEKRPAKKRALHGGDGLGASHLMRPKDGDQVAILKKNIRSHPKRRISIVFAAKSSSIISSSETSMISNILPNFRQILIIRNPIEFISSAMRNARKVNGGSSNWSIVETRRAVASWMKRWECAARLAIESNHGVFFLKYDDIRDEFEATCAHISAFLNVEPEFSYTATQFDADDQKQALAAVDYLYCKEIFQGITNEWESTSLLELLKLNQKLYAPIEYNRKYAANQKDIVSLFLRSGFYDPEEWGVWSAGKISIMRFSIQDYFLNLKFLTLKLLLTFFWGANSEFALWLSLNGAPAERRVFKMQEGGVSLELTFKPTVIRNELIFEFERTKQPTDEPIQELRALAMGLISFELVVQS